MMTRKDYVKVADILSGYQNAMIDQYWFEDLVSDFADFFASDNPNFHRERFIEACETIGGND
jgi:hypothetical protein